MLYTRDLSKRREELKSQIFDNFIENFPQYRDQAECFEDIPFEEEEVQSWKEDWIPEIEEISEIDNITDSIYEFDSVCTLISEDEFEDFCKELIFELGYLPKDTPPFIVNNIDWNALANQLKMDYSKVKYKGETYLYM